MGKRDKFQERKGAEYKRELKKFETRTGKKDLLIVFSLLYFDVNQGQSFEEWQSEKLLAPAMEKFRSLNGYTIPQAITEGIIKIYSRFPPESNFKHPKHIPPDIDWCSIRLSGKQRIIGYLEDNIFHIVFLDKEHEFWITKKKNT